MMYLAKLLASVTVIYWLSVIVAEAALVTSEERKMPASIRTGFGYMLIFAWFVAAWKVLTIGQSWALGIAVFGLYALARPKAELYGVLANAKASAKSYAVTFMWVMAGVNLFILPLHISGNYGPFTEGGGDVSVYADTPKYIADHKLPAYGIDDLFYDVNFMLNNPLSGTPDNLESFAKFDRVAGNPPIADCSVYRMVSGKRFSHIQYIPTGMWDFMADATNYHVFYAVMAFQYSILLLAVWAFFRRYGPVPAALALFITASSHGMISVYYNVYYLQGMCLALSALMLAATPHVRLLSWAGMRTYGISTAIIAAAYIHYMAIIGPLIFLIWKSDGQRGAAGVQIQSGATARALRAATVTIFLALFVPAVFLDAAGFAADFLPRIMSVINWAVSGVSLPKGGAYMGDAVVVKSYKWGSYFTGYLSQQHFEPFANQNAITRFFIPLALVAGALAALAGVVSLGVALVYRKSYQGGLSAWRILNVYLVAVLAVAVHHFMIQDSMYTQAKGAQNVLPMLYVALVLPFAAMYSIRNAGAKPRKMMWATGLCLTLFGVTLAVPRVSYGLKLAFEQDRGGILGGSYFREAERIMREDKNPFVWFEPRKSADLYTSIQPFADARMVPSRHLALITEWVKNKPGEPFGGFESKRDNIAYDFASADDIPHIWILASERKGGARWASYTWKAERLADYKSPKLLYSGYDYEYHFDSRPRSAAGEISGVYTYMRNGGVKAYLPAGEACKIEVKIEVKIEPRAESYDDMSKEIVSRISKGDYGDGAEMTSNGIVFTVTHTVPAREKATLVSLARLSGEFLFNARINGEEM